jgi:hypothetical protein
MKLTSSKFHSEQTGDPGELMSEARKSDVPTQRKPGKERILSCPDF